MVLRVDSTRIENVQRCTTAQHNAATYKDSFVTKSVDFCHVRGIKTSSTFSPDVDSSRITLSDTCQLITEKMRSKGDTRLDARRKGQSLQDGCGAFAWKFFFQTQQKGHEQAE
ncbi:hypothetical protein TNCV_864231 [Trichonephila clavipes]|nr:hypothetical protein TNCV_864231 [Trichonephila clavipes]